MGEAAQTTELGQEPLWRVRGQSLSQVSSGMYWVFVHLMGCQLGSGLMLSTHVSTENRIWLLGSVALVL